MHGMPFVMRQVYALEGLTCVLLGSFLAHTVDVGCYFLDQELNPCPCGRSAESNHQGCPFVGLYTWHDGAMDEGVYDVTDSVCGALAFTQLSVCIK